MMDFINFHLIPGLVLGSIYAGRAALIAAFCAGRRLDRYEAVALRRHREKEKMA